MNLLQFQTWFEEIKRELTLMHAFLTDTDKLKGKLETLKATLDKLRELIHEVDNLVIDCQIRADYRKN
ncbi:unnamed protein product [Ilex paraguariensis]|uniref:Disease resistance N-terminal domain-containing protein n=1 Tax=Ilex paraguariensis TaxID=185542 RepID=A0ABC8V3N2_9AQUA